MKKRSLYGINEHFEDIFNAVRECKMTFAYSSEITLSKQVFDRVSFFLELL